MTQGSVLVVTLGWRLRMAMERADISRTEMAERLGVHPATITRWTHDEGEAPRQIYLERWAEVTGVSVDLLIGPDVELDPQTRAHGAGRASTETVRPIHRRNRDDSTGNNHQYVSQRDYVLSQNVTDESRYARVA